VLRDAGFFFGADSGFPLYLFKTLQVLKRMPLQSGLRVCPGRKLVVYIWLCKAAILSPAVGWSLPRAFF
jgi:hypothetical protein